MTFVFPNTKSMKTSFTLLLTCLLFLFLPALNYSQNPVAPAVGTTKNFLLFTGSGDITNTGITSSFSGSLGTANGVFNNFEVLATQPTSMQQNTAASQQCKLDLNILYSDLSTRIPTVETSGVYGTQTLTAGVYHSITAASLNGILTLDGEGLLDSRFIIQTDGALTMGANTKILLVGGAQAQNVFWVIKGGASGAVIAADTEAKGNFICYDGTISLGENCVLDGSALTKNGAITSLDNMKLGLPIPSVFILTSSQSITPDILANDISVTGNPNPIVKWQKSNNSNFANATNILHYSPVLSGTCIGILGETTYFRAVSTVAGNLVYSNYIKIILPKRTFSQEMGKLANFVLYNKLGALTGGVPISYSGNVGTASGAITGFPVASSLLHQEDPISLAATSSLDNFISYINNTSNTKTTSAVFTDGKEVKAGIYEIATVVNAYGKIYLNAENNPDAIFIIKCKAALTFGTDAEIVLINGAVAANVIWAVDAAFAAGANCKLKGTFVSVLAGSAALGANCILDGHVFVNDGALGIGASCIFDVSVPMILASNQTISAGSIPADLVITGTPFPIVKWQKSIAKNFSIPEDILNISQKLSGLCMGKISHDTFYRAVVNIDGIIAFTNVIKISMSSAFPDLGPLASFVAFSSSGDITASGTTSFSGNIGANFGTIGGYPNLTTDSRLHTKDPLTALCASYLPELYKNIQAITTTVTPEHVPTFGSAAGETLNPGVYGIFGASNITGILILDGKNDPNSIFIFKIGGAFSTVASEVRLINDAQASHVFWVANGAISTGVNSKLIGTYICNAAIALADNSTIEGHAFTTLGAITIPAGFFILNPATTPYIATSDQLIETGTLAAALQLPGNKTPVTKWEKSLDPNFTTSTPIANTSNTLAGSDMGIINTTTYFRAVLLVGTATVYSSIVSIQTAPPSIAGTIGSNQTIKQGDAPANLILTGNNGTITKWQSALTTDFLNPTTYTTDAAVLTGGILGILDQTTYFRAVVQNCVCSEAYSNTLTVFVTPIIGSGAVTNNQAYCSDSTPNALVMLNNNGNIIKWQKSATADFANPININSYLNTLTGLEMGLLIKTTYFRAVYQKCEFPEVNSNVVKIAVNETTTWNGSIWSNNVPIATTKMIFDVDYNSTASLTACSITVNNNANVIINSGHDVTIENGITIDPLAKFILENDANLIQINPVINSGEITAKRNSFPLYRMDYTLWASPVSTQNLRSFSPESATNTFYFYNSSAGSNGTYQPIYNNPSFPNTQPDYNFKLAKGYLIRSPNNYASYYPKILPLVTTPGVVYQSQFTGEPNNGTITIALNPDLNGYNLVGNPYPSGIKIADFISTNASNIESTLWVWRKINNTNANAVGYATLNNTGITSAQVGVSSLPFDGIIKSGQGFFVKLKNPSSPTLTFNNSMRIGNNPIPAAGTFFKNANPVLSKNLIWLNLSYNGSLQTQALVGYLADATNGIDAGFDSKNFSDTPISLNSIVDNQEFAIQGRSLPFTVLDEVHLAFKTNIAGSFSISIDHFEGIFAANQEVFLKDNLTDMLYNLKIADYTFYSEIGSFNTRFVLVYQNKTLATAENKIIETGILVYKKDKKIHIESEVFSLNSIEIYDLNGKLMFTKKLNSKKEIIENLTQTKQVLLIKIKTEANGVLNTKLIF